MLSIMTRVADIFGISGQIELDEDRTTRTSFVGALIGLVLTFVSAGFLSVGRGPLLQLLLARDMDALTGDPIWNTLGWAIGAVLVPMTVVFSHQYELRQSLSPDHIQVPIRKKALGVVLVLGLAVSTVHAFLGSVQIRFGA
jgi:hypothetical protein